MSFKIVILGSGAGSNAKAILEAEKKGNLGAAKTLALLSDNEEAPILDLASQYEKDGHGISCNPHKAKLSQNERDFFISKVKYYNPNLVILAGFMKILDSNFIDALNGRIINLHPSLLPSFPGIDSIKKAFVSGAKITGCTVHWVTPELDAGPIIDQMAVPIAPEDSINSLTEKVHRAEHSLLPSIIKKISLGEILMP